MITSRFPFGEGTGTSIGVVVFCLEAEGIYVALPKRLDVIIGCIYFFEIPPRESSKLPIAGYFASFVVVTTVLLVPIISLKLDSSSCHIYSN